MAVTVQVVNAMMALAPDSMGIVAKEEAVPLPLHCPHIPGPSCYSGDGLAIIMVSEQNANPAIQSVKVLADLGLLAMEGKVTQVIDLVVWLHDGVPVVNQRLVHLLNRIEGTLAMADNVLVPKVGVRRKPDHNG